MRGWNERTLLNQNIKLGKAKLSVLAGKKQGHCNALSRCEQPCDYQCHEVEMCEVQVDGIGRKEVTHYDKLK